VLKARHRRPTTGREGMVGEIGEALADFGSRGGKVFVRGETWDAVSPDDVRKGDRVRVLAVHGLKLEVRRHQED
jgi:membrane-bound serine protease (ClpP class)